MKSGIRHKVLGGPELIPLPGDAATHRRWLQGEEVAVFDGGHQWKSCDLMGMMSSRRDGQLSGVRCLG